MWKKLIELGTFDNCYSQRINASFYYLNDEGQCQFSLKDLIKNGSYVFSYLSIEVEEESSFAVMDLFRLFDRSGRGTVNMKEFSLGVIEKLATLNKSNTLVSDMAEELFKVDTRPQELANRIDKMIQSSDKMPNIFRRNFKALAYVLVSKLRNISVKKVEGTGGLTVAGIVSLLHETIDNVISDVQMYFHIPVASRIPAVVPSSSSSKAPMIWDLTLLHRASENNSLDTQNNNSNRALLAHLLLEGDDDNTDSEEGETKVTSSGRERAMSTTMRGGGGRQRSVSGHGVDLMSTAGSNVMYDDIPSELYQALGVSNSGDLMQILKGLKDVDDSQLFLLQTAFRSIDNYFSLSAPHDVGDDEDGDQQQNATEVMNIAKHAKYKEIGVKYKKEKQQAVVSKSNAAATSSALIASHVVGGSNNNNLGFEYELVQDLFESQDQLRKARMRMNILEMVQSQMLGNSNYYDQLAGVSLDENATDPAEDVTAVDAVSDDCLLKRFIESTDGTALSINQADNNIANATLDIDDLLGNTSSADIATLTGEGILPGTTNDSAASDTVDKGENLSAETTYESIISELCTLKACLAERAMTEYPLGCFLESEVAVVPLIVSNKIDENIAVDATEGEGEKSDETTAPVSITSFNNNRSNVFIALKELTKMTKDMHDTVYKRAHTINVNENLVTTLKLHEDKINELRLMLEQSEIEKNEFMSLSIELQILREKNQKLNKDENLHKKLLTKNTELVRYSKDLEDQIGELKSKKNSSSSTSSTSDVRSDSKQILELKHAVNVLETKHNELLAENDRNSKEVVRLKNSIIISDQRLKGALSDHMTLHHQKEQVEEDAANAKSMITKLTRELEDMKMSRHYREDSEKKLAELQREINKRDIELMEYKETMQQINKLQSELAEAERIIEVLENAISEQTYELERGRQAMKEVDGCREAARIKSKEIRDKDLHIHGLEAQLKELPGLQGRYGELMDEVNACKMKMENIPRLLSEIAQLRGVSRANVKAQSEDTKKITNMGKKIKTLEQDNARLKNENASMRELENKVKELMTENKKHLIDLADLQALKVSNQNTIEEKKVLEQQAKAMKKHLRKSVAMESAHSPSPHSHKTMTIETSSSSSMPSTPHGNHQMNFSPQHTPFSSSADLRNIHSNDDNSIGGSHGEDESGTTMSRADKMANLQAALGKKINQ